MTRSLRSRGPPAPVTTPTGSLRKKPAMRIHAAKAALKKPTRKIHPAKAARKSVPSEPAPAEILDDHPPSSPTESQTIPPEYPLLFSATEETIPYDPQYQLFFSAPRTEEQLPSAPSDSAPARPKGSPRPSPAQRHSPTPEPQPSSSKAATRTPSPGTEQDLDAVIASVPAEVVRHALSSLCQWDPRIEAAVYDYLVCGPHRRKRAREEAEAAAWEDAAKRQKTNAGGEKRRGKGKSVSFAEPAPVVLCEFCRFEVDDDAEEACCEERRAALDRKQDPDASPTYEKMLQEWADQNGQACQDCGEVIDDDKNDGCCDARRLERTRRGWIQDIMQEMDGFA